MGTCPELPFNSRINPGQPLDLGLSPPKERRYPGGHLIQASPHPPSVLISAGDAQDSGELRERGLNRSLVLM